MLDTRDGLSTFLENSQRIVCGCLEDNMQTIWVRVRLHHQMLNLIINSGNAGKFSQSGLLFLALHCPVGYVKPNSCTAIVIDMSVTAATFNAEKCHCSLCCGSCLICFTCDQILHVQAHIADLLLYHQLSLASQNNTTLTDTRINKYSHW